MNFPLISKRNGILIALVAIAVTLLVSQGARAAEIYSYYLPRDEASKIYPSVSWLPEPYQKYYEGYEVDEIIKLFTVDSLNRDGIAFDSVIVELDADESNYVVTIVTDDKNASFYETVHPQFVSNYGAALQSIRKWKEQTDCWNKNNTHKDEPWAFFPQFGLPMAMQRSVLMLNYPPSTALTKKNYLNTFTMNRWTRVLGAIGIDDPTLYETIVDVRPIAAPGSGTSDNLPDAQTYFNDPTGTTGGYYINPQLSLMVEPQPPGANDNTLPLVVLGMPAREDWNKITGVGEGILNTGVTTIPGATRPTPYILGNHPDVTTYQCCPGDPSSQCDNSSDLVADEEIDVQIACWAQAMSDKPDSDPEQVLADCRDKWVTNRSAADDLTFCALARIDSNECFDKDIDWATAVDYCKSHDNKPCATYQCPTKDSVE